MREILLNVLICSECSEVITSILCDSKVISKLVRFVYIPRIKEELVIHISETSSHLFLCHCSHTHIVEVATVSLCGRLYEYFTGWCDCIQCTCLYFPRFVWILVTYLSILRDVK